MKRYIDAAATSIPAATGGKASFGRKRPAEEEVPGPKTPPEAKAKRALPKPLPVKAGSPAVASPKTSPKQDPKSRCQCRSEPKMAAKPLMIGLTAQAPTEIWRSTKGGRLWLAGLPLQSTESKFPRNVAVQVTCFAREAGAAQRSCAPGCPGHDLLSGLQGGA